MASLLLLQTGDYLLLEVGGGARLELQGDDTLGSGGGGGGPPPKKKRRQRNDDDEVMRIIRGAIADMDL